MCNAYHKHDPYTLSAASDIALNITVHEIMREKNRAIEQLPLVAKLRYICTQHQTFQIDKVHTVLS
jgi:hypothetical protein